MKKRNITIMALALTATLQFGQCLQVMAAVDTASQIETSLELVNTDEVYENILVEDNQIETAKLNHVLNHVYISEVNYDSSMKNIVEPYLNKKIKTGYFTGEAGAQIYYERYSANNAKGNIVISHGFSESLEKFHEMIYYFLQSGYNVFAIEHRGHGRSGSLGVKDESQVHVEKFDYYVNDLKTFMDTIVNPSNTKNKPVFLFAHSMGGGIGSKFLEENPGYFTAAVLSAPMMEVNTGSVPAVLAQSLAKAAVLAGRGGNYVAGQGAYAGPDYNIDEIGTSCVARYDYANNIVAANSQFQRGGASYNWLNEAFNATKSITSKENASKVEIPVLLFQAGQDTFVNPTGQNNFAKYAKNCTLRVYKEARHELFRENDTLYRAYLEEVFEFFNTNCR